MNTFNITGKIYKDLTLRTTTSGKQVLDIPLAITNTKDDSTFLNITTFNKTAENVSKYCKKGDTLGIEGIIKNHNREKDGVKHYDYSFLATRVEFLNIKKQEQKQEEQKQEAKEEPKETTIYQEDIRAI